MTQHEHDDLERQEEAHRDLTEALGELSQDLRASPGFVTRVMAHADQRRRLQQGWLGWVSTLPWLLTGPVRFAVAAILMLAVLGAVPQYLNWINAYRMDVPSNTLQQAKLQEQLWEKNFNCATQLDRHSSNYAVINGEQVVVVAWACPSGDVLVSLESTTDDVLRRSVWIPLNAQPLTVGLLPNLVETAFAGEGLHLAKRRGAPMVTVLCQRWLPKRLIVRRIQLENGGCFDELINPRTGKVIQRRKAPCSRKC